MPDDQPQPARLQDLAILGGDPDGLAAEARPLGPKPGPKRVEIADMVLPPADLVDDLDNSRPAPVAAEPEDEDVTLDFFGDLPMRDFPLRHPFAWNGERVEVIEVRQLTTAEVGRVVGGTGEKGVDLYEVYSMMCCNKATGTRIPARVLRKLPAVDGMPIVDHLYDFSRRCFLVEAA